MSVIANIAFRNLSRQKKRSFLLGGAIAFGIMIVTLINGFAGAFINNVSENFAYLMAGHVFVTGNEKTASGKSLEVIRDDSAISAALKNAGIKPVFITRTSEFQGTLVFETKTARQNITGIDLSSSSSLKERLVLASGNWDAAAQKDAIIISEKIAKKLNAQAGDRLLVQLSTLTGQNNVGEFTVAAINRDTSIIGAVMAYANLDYVNELVGLKKGEYMSMGLMLSDLKESGNAAEALYKNMKTSGLQLFDRGTKNENGAVTPFQAMMRNQKKEKWEGIKYRILTIDDIMSEARQIVTALDTASLIILIVLFFIIMVGITNTFRMVMYERIREIGTMRAVGVQRGEIRGLFLYEALFLAIGGAVAGIALSLVLMGILSLFNFGMDSPIFLIMKNGHLSFFVPPFRAIFNVLLIAVLTLAAAFFPARNAARLEPAEALRTQK